MEKLKLSEKERLSYVLQLEILETLHPEDDSYKNIKKALSCGYTYHYEELFSRFLNEKELSIEDCKLVLDILDMYRSLIFSAQLYKWEDMSRVTFRGFDCNDMIECKMSSYAKYFMEDLDRYDEIKELSKGNYNSHIKMLPKYRKMLQEYQKSEIINGYILPEDNMKKILEV